MTRRPVFEPEFGARTAPGGTRICIWAPGAAQVAVTAEKLAAPLALVPAGRGCWEITTPLLGPGDRYRVHIDGGAGRPDPVSRLLPEGVHGPTEIVDPGAYVWQDAGWRGIALADCIFYEMHVGTFTPAGTFAGVVERLPYLKALGVTCLEIMPVAQFPGQRNWGYDGVSLYAVQESYGGPQGLKELVDACHREGLAVCLDVVYNHLGPEGNYLDEFGPYFTDAYATPWGRAVNYDGENCTGVRELVLQNALYWFAEYHIDALRLDAVHGIYDNGPVHILRELAARAAALSVTLKRPCLLIAENELNDPRLLTAPEADGCGLDGVWSDDFHHAVHVLLTGERGEYYRYYTGFADLVPALERGFVYDDLRPPVAEGQYHLYGGAPVDLARLVHCVQNHDQVGNRARGDRLTETVALELLEAAAAVLLLAPPLPLIFMGQEYAETAPFCYFVDHGDPGLLEAVRRGRAAEFPGFQSGEVPDPADPGTMERSRLSPACAGLPEHRAHLEWYRELIRLRKRIRPGERYREGGYRVEGHPGRETVCLSYGEHFIVYVSFARETVVLPLPGGGEWRLLAGRRAGLDGAAVRLEPAGIWIGARDEERERKTD